MIYIDEVRFFELLDKAVAERGSEYTYERVCGEPENASLHFGQGFCMYVDMSTGEKRPSCLVGMMLYLAGVPLETLHRDNYVPVDTLINYLSGREELIRLFPHYLIRNYFSDAQVRQDHGDTWGSIANSLRAQSSYHSNSITRGE
jgi:hypothetical protein